MRDTAEKGIKTLHGLIDELTVYIGFLKQSSPDPQMAELFCRRLFRGGRLLNDSGYGDLSRLAVDIHDAFGRVFNRSLYVTHELLQTSLAFLTLARKALMFSDAPDFRDATEPIILELHSSLHRLRQCADSSKAKHQQPQHTDA